MTLPDGGRLLHLNTGALRDWRLLQQAKNALFGAEAEAIDLLLPTTRGEGPLLLVVPEHRRFAFGWASRLVRYEDSGAARQRAQ